MLGAMGCRDPEFALGGGGFAHHWSRTCRIDSQVGSLNWVMEAWGFLEEDTIGELKRTDQWPVGRAHPK